MTAGAEDSKRPPCECARGFWRQRLPGVALTGATKPRKKSKGATNLETGGYSKLSRWMVFIEGGSGAKPCVVPRETTVSRIRRSIRLFEDLVRRARHKVGEAGSVVRWCFG